MRRVMLMLAPIMALLAAFVPAAGADFGATNGTIAFVSLRDGNSEIYAVNPDGTELNRLTNNPRSDRTPAWSPDGTKIAFASSRSGNFEIYADGTNVRQLTNHPAVDACPEGFQNSGSAWKTAHSAV
jgi:dipeptidyl aminopeptidase/acylaminoacyl peptidase